MILVRDVSLVFRQARARYLRDRLARLVGHRPAHVVQEPVAALRGVDLRIARGERVGVIGLNGAGKTSLLKVICGIYPPTTGKVMVDGEIACLFELATGFEMEATGWDNLRMRGLLVGMTAGELEARTQEIAEFSELGAALDRPVKTFSAGMFVRLAFAVSTAFTSDVLLLDEVIAAGDILFQEKARRRLEQMVEQASILVLVSHSLEAVRQMCGRAIWLHEGRMRMDGTAAEVTAAYSEFSQHR